MIFQTIPKTTKAFLLVVLFSIMFVFTLPVSADGDGDGSGDPSPGKIPASIWWINHMVGISITFQQ